MLKQCTALFLLAAFMASTFSKAIIVADFYANQDYIARTLCVNRNNPIIHCGGRCQLCKRLKNDARQDQKYPERRADNKEVLFVESTAPGLQDPVITEITLPYGLIADRSPVDQPANIDHPPA
ncbi:MAG TPA: hypothetical protein VG605_09980 [Puia sp.]|nr:hypothetical protein [Puia sp.]